jgi:hypothetical protein
MRRALALFALLLLAPARAHAGPWVPGRWHFYAQLRESFLFADQRYDARGDLQPIRLVLDASGQTAEASYRQALTDLYLELGLASRLAVIADFHALSAIVEPVAVAPSRSAVGASDLWLASKLLLFDDEIAAALEVAMTVPLGRATAAIPLGQGDFSTDFVLLLGKLFERPSLFFSVEAGLRLRSYAEVADPNQPGRTLTQEFAHQIRFAGSAGWQWLARKRGLAALLVSAKFEGAYALAAPVEDGLGLLDPRAPSYFKLGPELGYTPVRGLSFVLGAHYFVAARSLPAMAEIALGLGVNR